MGNDLDLCLAALTEQRNAGLHLLERIDMSFSVQVSIIADAANLTRFKASGKLPSLALNISNSKYQGLMRIIDIAIPHFGQPLPKDSRGRQFIETRRTSESLFITGDDPEYLVEEEDVATAPGSPERATSPHVRHWVF